MAGGVGELFKGIADMNTKNGNLQLFGAGGLRRGVRVLRAKGHGFRPGAARSVPGSARVPRAGAGVSLARTSHDVRSGETIGEAGDAFGKFVVAGRQNQHSGRVCSPD